MLIKQRYDEDRIPTEQERIAVRVLAQQSGMSFAQAWIKYMKREQRLLEVILRADAKIAQGEIDRGLKPMFGEEDTLETIQNIMEVLGCSAYRAMMIYYQSPEKECDPDRTYHDLSHTGQGGIDDADFYTQDPYHEDPTTESDSGEESA